MIYLSVIGITLAACVLWLFVKSYGKCKHGEKRQDGWHTWFSDPVPGVIVRDWYYHEFTMPQPQLAGVVFKCYRQDVSMHRKCLYCGLEETYIGYNQKLHESDTMHKTPVDFVPEPQPEGISEEKLRERISK